MPLINKLILGTVQFGLPYGINNTTGMPADDDVDQILDIAYDAGINILDTAEAYGSAIERIGAYHRKRNHLFSVINKFKDVPAPDQLLQHISENASSLNVPVIDTYLFHSYNDYLQNPKLLQGLATLKTSGAINAIGVSVYTNEQFDAVINDGLVSVIQFPYNLLDNDNLRLNLMEKAKANGKTLHTRSVFLQGLFFKDVHELPVKLKPLISYVAEIQKIAAKHQLDITTLALNYALSNTLIDGVLIGVDSATQLRNNISAIKDGLVSEIRNDVNNIVVKELDLLNPANWN